MERHVRKYSISYIRRYSIIKMGVVKTNCRYGPLEKGLYSTMCMDRSAYAEFKLKSDLISCSICHVN